MFYLIFSLLAIVSISALLLTKVYKNENPLVDKIAKIAVVVWMSLYFLNLFLPDGLSLRNYDDITPFLSGEHIWFVLLRWCNDVAFLVLPVAVFFKKESFIKITGYFLLIVCLANVAVYFQYAEFFTSELGAGIAKIRFFSQEFKDFLYSEVFRAIYFGGIMLLELVLIVFVVLRNFEVFKKPIEIKNTLTTLGIFALLFLSIMPIYAPQYIFKGYSYSYVDAFDTFKMGKPFHFIWIISLIIEGIALTLLFKDKTHEDKYIVVLMLSLSLVMQYHQMFTCIGEITAHRMPFQLCNMAGFFILLTLLTKSERLYHFTLVINSVGAIIALVMCDTSPFGVAYVMNIHYMLEHTNVILAPILCATLGVFPKLKNKDVLDSLAGFAVYFTFVLVVGGIFTGLKELGGPNADYWNCNYLYIHNKSETVAILGFVAPLFDIKIKLFNFFTLSLVQLVVFIVFSAICTGAFFAIKALLNIGSKKTKEPEQNESNEHGNAVE
ncbi:MAG: hypothetical protein E7343_04820 [Clostridiales bacterium]|nr:hypothetical protein [Clostridiales bacterium]